MFASENSPPTLLLASASPRRQELLTQIGVQFRVVPHHVDESMTASESSTEFVQRMALEKARSALSDSGAESVVVLGADTIVVADGEVMGKPSDRHSALAMLEKLSNNEHSVYSAVTLASNGDCQSALSHTRVRFREISAGERHDYWASGEPEGKAGAYAIQGVGAVFVSNISGSYSGVVGLPLFETSRLLTAFGIYGAHVTRAG